DDAMYERMARLLQPGRRQAAILFADIEGSGLLSRKLPTAAYFELVRRFAAEADEHVAHNQGIVGKHAGDGLSAFFLTDDLGSASRAAAAAIVTAKSLCESGARWGGSPEADGDHPRLRIGIHWGGGLYMGQLV